MALGEAQAIFSIGNVPYTLYLLGDFVIVTEHASPTIQREYIPGNLETVFRISLSPDP